MRIRIVWIAMVAVLLFAGAGASIQSVSSRQATPVSDAPIPVTFPQDDGPHAALIEWWYYTGHLYDESGQRFGFQYVIFKAERSGITGYVGHFAVTDGANQRFVYDQRLALADPSATPTASAAFDLAVGDWTIVGADGEDRLIADQDGISIDLQLTAEKPPALHDGDGYIDYGSGEASYYYSRTRMSVTGLLTVDGEAGAVTGEAWFDHQWGDFQTFTEGGWDWFSIQLENGTDLMLYVIRDAAGEPRVIDGSIVDTDGSLTVLDGDDFTISPLDTWTSPATNVTYPSGWKVQIPAFDIDLVVTPVMLDQELDTRQTTGVIYWEGEVTVSGTVDGVDQSGLGYVELTGYADDAAE